MNTAWDSLMMLTKKAGRYSFFRRIILSASLLVGVASTTWAQDELTPSEIYKKAITAMQGGQHDEAIDYMYMYLGIVESSVSPRVVAIAQDVRYKMATMLLQQNRYDEAAAVLQDYIDTPLASHMRQAMKLLANCYYEAKAYEECASTITNALYYDENPVILAVTKTDEEGDEVDFSAQSTALEPEEPFSAKDLLTLNVTLGEAYFNYDQWAECIAPYSYVIEHTDNQQQKGYAIMQIINALLNSEDYDRILEWVPQLYRTDARFDIRVNLALMKAAAELYDVEEYDAALPLYRMILPRDELIAYQEARLRDLRIAADMAPEEGTEMTADEMLLFGVEEETTTPAATEEATTEEPEKPKEIQELEDLIKILKGLPPYELDINYRMADLYKTVERYWEAMKFFDLVYKADPTTEVGERCIYELVDMLLENLDQLEEAETRGIEHIGKFKEGMTPRQIAYMLTGYYGDPERRELMPKIKTLKPYIDEFVRTNDATIVRYDAELYFMQAIADLVAQNFEGSEAGFKYVLDEFPESHQEPGALYWYSMSQLFLQKYAEALPNFDQYISKFPQGQYVDECTFQGGICKFGLEDYVGASNRFSFVINTYPNSSVYPEARNMRGDIYGSNGELDEALEDYEKAYEAAERAGRVQQATYSTFQAAEIYEAEDKYENIIAVVERYEADWREQADIAKALFWIGKTKIQQKLYFEAAETYVDAVIRYGGNLREDGVDSMITELVKISSIYLTLEERETMDAMIAKGLSNADNETLSLRLRVLQAKLEDTELELGKQLLVELETLDNASPPVLATICDASFESEDYSRAEELLRIFINKFEDSDFMRAAYKLRAFGQYEEKDYDGVLATINDAQALYGTEYDVAWAQLLKSQVLLDQGDIEAARDENMMILTVPAWRGVPVAQATYQLGQVEAKAGNLAKSHGFYQRVYMQYKGHAGGYWAAEAYLSAAEVLKQMGPEYENDVRNTYRAMLFDRYVNELPQAEVASKYLGNTEVLEIQAYIETGGKTNISVKVEAEMSGGPKKETSEKAAEKETETPVSTEEGA